MTVISLVAEKHRAEFASSAIDPELVALNIESLDLSWTFDNDIENRDVGFILEKLNWNTSRKNDGRLRDATIKTVMGFGGGWHILPFWGLGDMQQSDYFRFKPDIPQPDPKKGGKLKKYLGAVSSPVRLYTPNVPESLWAVIAARYGVPKTGINFWEWLLAHPEIPVIITEGEKKALSGLSAGYVCVSLPGIDCGYKSATSENGTKYLELIPDLIALAGGERSIKIAFDRDTNPETVKRVDRSCQKLATLIGELDCKIFRIQWGDNHKGLDDFIAGSKPDVINHVFNTAVDITPVLNTASEFTKPPTPLDLARVATYFHTADKVAYADIWIDSNRHTYAVRSKAFKLWLMGEQYKTNKTGINSQSFQDTLPTLESIAIFEGETRQVHLRTAEYQGKIYLDLGTLDWRAAEIDVSGWRVIGEPPVRFWRPDSMLPLPHPVEGGSLDELKDLLNVDGASWTLIVTFLLFSFCPEKLYPVLVLSAHRGSGKTAAAEILKGLIDPGKAGLIKLQGDTLKLAVAATCRHLMVYDNVGHISPDQSDDLCRLATGFGYSTRTLHTTSDETTFEFTRPQIITAIDALVTRDDLADRVLMAQLPEIPEHKRLPQGELKAKVEAARPLILGALLTALSQTLAQLPHTKPATLPRMADYALFAIASEKALGLAEGEFMYVFNESREQSRQVVIESSPVGEAIIRLMEVTPLVWKGTASELLNELAKHTDEATYRSRYFPKASNILSRQLTRLAPDLKALGIDIKKGMRLNSNDPRSIVLEKVLKTSSTSSTSSTTNAESATGANTTVDDTGNSIVHQPSTNHLPIVHSSESGRYTSSTPEAPSTNHPLPKVIDTNALTTSVDGVDDVDDTLASSPVVETVESGNNFIPARPVPKVGDFVLYIGTNKALKRQYKGMLKVHSLSIDGACCYKEDRSLTGWIELTDLQ